MSPVLLFCVLIAYFGLLLGVAWATSRNATNDSFYIGNKSSNSMLVAFGMVGTTLSGATFISVPGAAGAPILCAIIEFNQTQLLGSYRLGLELLMVNGIFVFAGLFAIPRREKIPAAAVTA